ncbi:putative cytochrome P450 [Medicago truncatula]|uniref:Cytochrome P450 family 94 protein n=1 Tax=Medicago truncatula TaxID=3880 RepID=A0A072U2E7_MEDTR|nr:cytochrome P450 94A1 [Medicago truncatula]KEH23872.1 cytochrome P450 family 94 protein [Medicago truncatula]RHN48163.1 putative cytochrome P450 [Medicago truncatula]
MFEMLLPYLLPILLLTLPLLFFLTKPNKKSSTNTNNITIPKSYPLIGSYLSFRNVGNRRIQWLSDIIQIAPSATFNLNRPLGTRQIITGNPSTVQHILKNQFSNYQKSTLFTKTLYDLLDTGIFNTNGENWKFQRQVASHEFNTKSLRKFVEDVVDTELSDRLIPILSLSIQTKQILDFQDILQRFTFDNICKISFGFDPEYLTPSTNKTSFAKAFEDATEISGKRFRLPLPVIWKMKKCFNIGSEKRLHEAITQVREFAKKIIREKKLELKQKLSLQTEDMLSRLLSSSHFEEDFVTNIVISFILAGKDSTSAALTWFFWLLWKNPRVEEEILKEINEKSTSLDYDEVKTMVYTHAALSESMRLYPPVPMDSKEAINDDVLPDGKVVKKGTMITYHVYAMGRMESLWGEDWAEFRPERWLENDGYGKRAFVPRDPFTYPVFQAGPRICLGKEMAFMQMKRIVAGIVGKFKVVPEPHLAEHPNFISFVTSQMEGGFPVTVHKRIP